MTKADLKKKNIYSISKGGHTPLDIAQKVPWEKIKHCVVVYEDPDTGESVIHVSCMPWSARAFLSFSLQAANCKDIYEDAEHV